MLSQAVTLLYSDYVVNIKPSDPYFHPFLRQRDKKDRVFEKGTEGSDKDGTGVPSLALQGETAALGFDYYG